MKRIMVPVDFTPESRLAMDWAVRVAREEDDALLLLCYIFPRVSAPVGPEALTFPYPALYDTQKGVAERKMKNLMQHVPPDVTFTQVIVEGDTADQIQRLCQEYAIDLVIMTTHGRRGLSHLLHGSIAEATVRLVPCPVMVLHMNAQTEQAAQPAHS